MNKISLIKRLICALSIVIFASCDDEFNDVGADIVGGDVHSDIVKLDASLVAYDRATGPVQSNNLTVNTLGVYNNPVFGKTTASYVTQVSLASPNPTFYGGLELDSVYLYVPYYSRLTGADATTGKTTYELDSIFGSKDAQLTLSIKRNGFFLRGADAASGGVAGQKYYSSDKSLVDAQAGVSLLADGKESQSFSFSAAEIERTATPKNGTPKVVEKLAPGMFINLNKAAFEQAILKAPSGKLLNNSIFTEYFRGIYFKAEQTGGGQSVMGTPNFAKGIITIKYHDDVPTTVNGESKVVETAKTLTLNLTGNSINFFENENSGEFTSALATSNTTDGDSKLYIKGGEGSMGFVNISRNSLKDLMRENNAGNRVLINEANIVFNVDVDKMVNVANPNDTIVQPQRIYLYDLKNRRPLFDYSTDVTTNTIFPKKNKAVHGGIAEYNRDKAGKIIRQPIRYKIRVTDFINNIVNKDSLANVENIQLGLVVTETINVVTNASLKNPLTELGQNVSIFPVGSVMHPFGTVLFGGTSDVPADKRLKLEIFYTKPKQ